MEAYVLVVVIWEELDSWESLSIRPLVCCKFERNHFFYYIFGVRSKRDPFQKIDLGLKFLDMTSILQYIRSRINILRFCRQGLNKSLRAQPSTKHLLDRRLE